MTLLVGIVLHNHQGRDTMVLDTIDEENDMLTFKNTYDDPEKGGPKQFQVRRTDPNAPEELYFVHIEVKDMHILPVQEVNEEPLIHNSPIAQVGENRILARLWGQNNQIRNSRQILGSDSLCC